MAGFLSPASLQGYNSSHWDQANVTFDGAAGSGAVGTVEVGLYSGTILLRAVVSVCLTDLVSAGGGTLAFGVTGSTSLFIAATTATTIDQYEIWTTTTPTAGGIALPAACKDIVLTGGVAQRLLLTVGGADITAGALTISYFWDPMSTGAAIVTETVPSP